MNPELSDEVRIFIFENIDSVGKLEVLLLLESTPGQSWTSKNVSVELRSTEAAARKYLTELTAKGLLKFNAESDPTYRYAPANADLDRQVKKLVTAKSTFYARIIHLIYDRPIEQIRELANAFRIRKENDDG